MKHNRLYTFLSITGKKRLHSLNRTVLILIVLCVSLVGYNFTLFHRMDNATVVEQENKTLREKIENMDKQVSHLEAKLEKMSSLASELQNMAAAPASQGPSQNVEPSSDQSTPTFSGRRPFFQFFPIQLPTEEAVIPKVSRLEQRIQNITYESSNNETYLKNLYDSTLFFRATPNILPTRGWISSRFGFRKDPFTGLPQLHTGLDIATFRGSTVHAPADGVVVSSGRQIGYGHMLTINHGYGITTRYAHNSKHLVKVGDKVKRGTAIAIVGSSGRSTGAHLHYEIRVKGIPVDPAKYTSAKSKIPASTRIVKL